MAKHSRARAKNSKKTIGIISLVVILVIALGIVAYQAFYPRHSSDKSTTFAQTSATKENKKSKEKSERSSSTSAAVKDSTSNSSSSTSEQSTSQPTSWANLTEKQADSIYAQWINNAQGKFDIYTGETYLIYLVNVGTNGVSTYNDPVNVIKNTARVQVNADGTYYLQVPNPTQTGLRMSQDPWSIVQWQTKETLTGAQLFAKYGADSSLNAGAAQIKSINSGTIPNGN